MTSTAIRRDETTICGVPRWAAPALAALLLLVISAPLAALPVPEKIARQVAQNTIREHLVAFGSWGGVLDPRIDAVEPVDLGGDRLAYNVRVRPSGHILVAADDEFNPVLLYSDTHAFNQKNAGDPDSLEAWIVPEVGHVYARLKQWARERPEGVRPEGWTRTHVSRAWDHLAVPETSFEPRRRDHSSEPSPATATAGQPTDAGAGAGTVVGPLLTSDWAQGAPYWNYTPAGSGCAHTVSGCVALAAVQIMKYWNWPESGTGSHSYTWNSQVLSANFAHPYNWSIMPRTLSAASTAQIDAVARLISDVGIAVEMGYGCGGSGAYTAWIATTVLPTYFSYKATTGAVNRSTHTPAEFFAHVQEDLNASPRRPLLFSVRTLDGASGHALVIDGYQTGSADLVHLNLGWGASYQGWYNINADWSAGGYQWNASSQVIYQGIAPAAAQHTVTLARAGTGTGTVTSTPAGVNCGTTCSAPFDQGTTARMTATASPGSHFVAWGGDCDATGGVVASGDRTCTATFTADNPAWLAEAVDNLSLAFTIGGTAGWYYQTAVTQNGGDAAQSGQIPDGGTSTLQTTVTGPSTLSFFWRVSSEDGFDYLTCYLDGTAQPGKISGEVAWRQITLSIPAGEHVVRWEYSKDASTVRGSDTAWVDNLVVTVITSTLSVSRTGNGTGTVSSLPAGIACGSDCTEVFGGGTVVTMTAAPASGSIFVGWTGACTGLAPCTVTLDSAKSVSANFQATPVYRRYFAEGAVSNFFNCWFALLNTEGSAAHVTMRFLKDGASSNVAYLLEVPAGSRRTVDARQVPGLFPSGGFSTIIESDVPVVADRTMSWDADGYGAHTETSIEGPAPTWYVAEGSTFKYGPNGPFNLYYLLQNPNDRAVDVQVTYLRPAPKPPIIKVYSIDAQTRRTIWVNAEDSELASTDVSGVVSSLDPTAPIIVERAMYLDSQDKQFGAGHDAAGVTSLSTDWFLAEGATGPVFDMYVLLTNPNGVDAELDVTYLLPDGRAVLKHYQAAANSRRTIWVNGEQAGGVDLANTSVSTRVHSTNGVPVIVERAMWWPRSGWYEAHCSAGFTTTGTTWVLAEGEQGGSRHAQTYILTANTSTFAGRVHITLLFEDGSTASADVDVPANSRTTVWTGGTEHTPDSPFGGLASGKRFGAVIESVPVNGQTARVVVERSIYWDAGGAWWAAGTNSGGTKIR